MTNESEQLNERPVCDDTDGFVVDLWVRRPVCGPRTTVIDRLSTLRGADVLDDFDVTTWPEEIPLTGDNGQAELLETIEAYEAWAADRGLSLRPPFETRTASLLVGDSEDVLKTPMLLAAAHEDGDLVGIYPCTDGTETWTVPEFLDALEADAERPPGLDDGSPLSEGTTS
ncbi:HTH domain-containing protein [Haloarcula laminariae]|uniref:HTH domain-containing protein n=1 Tax=Haloarcula laminariae TaxID=2961577 RepID=UPI0021C9D889|nr:HTH domain-containing protein [Halomicroarcula laminariae]